MFSVNDDIQDMYKIERDLQGDCIPHIRSMPAKREKRITKRPSIIGIFRGPLIGAPSLQACLSFCSLMYKSIRTDDCAHMWDDRVRKNKYTHRYRVFTKMLI